MIEWLNANVQYWHWFVGGIILAALEMFVPSFFMLWLGVSAFIVGLVLLIIPTISFTIQLLLWSILSVICLVTWFKFITPKMKDRTKSGMAKEAMYGKVGIVLEYNASNSRGRLRFPAPLMGDDEWRFICEDTLTAGDKVKVTDTSGNDLIVELNS